MSNEIGNRIKEIRIKRGFTQEMMGNILKVTQSNYGRLEKDDSRLTVPTLITIAEWLNVSLYDLTKVK